VVFIGGDSAYGYPLLNRSTDLGTTWTHSHSGLSGSVAALAAGSGDIVYCGTSDGLYKSTDAGANWTRRGTMTQVRAVCVDAADADFVYAGTNAGVFASTDAGATWQQFNTGLGNTDVMALALRSGPTRMLYAGTNGSGVFATTPLSGTAEPRPSSLALPHALTATVVRGTLRLWDCHPVSAGETRGCTQPILLDAAGRKVMILGPGANDVRSLAPGIYFMRQASSVRKLVLQR
jgi:hypothetical protein